MATQDDVLAHTDSIYEALTAAEAAHPDCPHLAVLHQRLYAAKVDAFAHFEITDPAVQARGGGDKDVPETKPEV